MQIINTSNSVEIIAETTISINKSDIEAVKLDPNDDFVYYILADTAGISCGYFRFDYRDVTSPVVASALDLFNELDSYADGGTASISSAYQLFTAGSGQTDFTVTSFTLDGNYKVFLAGVYQSFGYDRTGNTIEFDVPVPEGTEVMVLQ